jgi:hypothetical protein
MLVVVKAFDAGVTLSNAAAWRNMGFARRSEHVN